MELRKVVAFQGPNIWAPSPMLEACVVLGEPWSGYGSPELLAFNARLAAWLPLLPDPADLDSRHQDRADGLLTRLAEGPALAEALQCLTLRLQRAAGCRTVLRRGFTRAMSIAGHYRVAIEFEEESLARLCLASAWEMCLAAASQGEFDPASELLRLRAFADRYCLGPSTQAIVEAARKRQIPARRLNDRSLVQLGHGIHQRRIFTAETDRTSAIAEGIAQDKELTKTLLRAVGVPVPEGRIVHSAADAWKAASEIGLPVVVKPRDANHGRGVALNLSTRHQVEAAYTHAVAEGDGVIVERCARGAEHRLLVVGDRLVAASRGEPEQVVGDGQHTVAELVDILNLDPRRGLEFAFPLGKVELDAVGLLTLEQQGYRPDLVPFAGAAVIVHSNGDYTTDETDEVHPDVAAQAVLAAQVIGLDVAGIDVIAQTVSRPLREQGGVVIEVNAGPGLRMHLEPQRGRPRAVGEVIVESMFPDGQSGRIPLVAACGRQSAVVTRLVAQLLREAGHCIGLANREGVYVNDRSLEISDGTLSQQEKMLLLHPRLTAAVLECSASAILEEGLAFERCDVAIVGSLAEEFTAPVCSALAFSGAEPVDPGALERVVAGTVGSDGYLVLWADDPLAEQSAAASRSGTIWLATDGDHPRLAEARRREGRVAFIRENAIWFAAGAREWPLARDDGKVALGKAAASFGWEPLLAVAAVGWGLGLAERVLAVGLEAVAAAASETGNGRASGVCAN